MAICLIATGASVAADRPAGTAPAAKTVEHPLSAEQRKQLADRYASIAEEATNRLKERPRDVALFSRRGDAYFFLGRFKDAVADYERMVELDASLAAEHWRRGIAYFYAGRHKDAARQFELYHSYDDVDRENGIWRYLSQVKAYGREKARKELLKYEKTDREPFPAVYRLFAGETTADEILQDIEAARLNDAEREQRLFYANLYIGLNHAVEDRPQEAAVHLRRATANRWASDPKAGYGPHYMWHVGRMHLEKLLEAADRRHGGRQRPE
ncbi:MAG: hypothetical protein KY476_19780 [Planctomycetes bacterium]|nr:hypothetical protein [Planctomycetota bacterium]